MLWSKATPADAVHSFDEHVHAHLAELERDIAPFLRPLAEELGPLHKTGQMHGGICPAALRYDAKGELDRKHFMLQRREPGIRPGSQVPHAYLAPETLEGSGEDSRADCYALGALLFQIIIGQPPAPATRRKGKADVVQAENHPTWPPKLLDAVNHCLALEKEKRIATVQELWQALSTAPEQPGGVISESKPDAQPNAAPANSIEASLVIERAERKADAAPASEGLSATEPIVISSSAELRPTKSVALPAAELPAVSPKQASPSEFPAPTVAPTAPLAPAFPSKIQIRERLANASVGKPYRQSLREVFGEQASRVRSIALTFPEDSGLMFDQAEDVLHGTPKKPGELKLTLLYQLADTPAGRSALTSDLALTINPDPKSLWKNLPSDSQGLFAKPDEDKASLVTPQLTAIAASLRGRSHAHEGKYRDDDFAMRYLEATGWHIFIAADGAGSAKYSRRGSQLACRTAVAELESKLAGPNDLEEALGKLGGSANQDDIEKLRKIAFNLLVQPAYQASTKISDEAKQQQATLRDFATTFILVLAKKLETKWFFASFAIGDGGAGAMVNDERVQLLTQPDSGEFAGQTIFLTTPQVFNDTDALLARAQAAFCDDFKFLAVMTDGITDPIFQSDAKFADAAAWGEWQKQLLEAVKFDSVEPGMEQALLDYLRFPSPGNHDDRTLIVAVPKLNPSTS